MINFLFYILLVNAIAESQRVSFPQIISWKNSPSVEFEQKKMAIIKKDQVLKNAFTVTTGPEDQIQLQFSAGESIIILPNSKVIVPQVSPDTGDISEIYLVSGKLRYQAGLLTKLKIKLKSDFFELKIPRDTELFVIVDLKVPMAQLQMISGELKVAFMDFEKTAELKSGQQVMFKGEADGLTIKYDYLLNDRKAPHGVLQEVEKFDTTFFSNEEKAKAEAIRKSAEQKKKDEALRLKKQKAYEGSFLCHKPYGQKDQCHWILKKDLCFRLRCNVSGQWGDETERPVIPACANLLVDTCDY